MGGLHAELNLCRQLFESVGLFSVEKSLLHLNMNAQIDLCLYSCMYLIMQSLWQPIACSADTYAYILISTTSQLIFRILCYDYFAFLFIAMSSRVWLYALLFRPSSNLTLTCQTPMVTLQTLYRSFMYIHLYIHTI